MASHSQTYSLWILTEGNPQPYLYRLPTNAFNLPTGEEPNLSDLSSYLVQNIEDLAKVRNYRLEFLQHGQTLRISTKLKDSETSDTNPIIVRYPLSSSTIVANVRFLGSWAEIRLPHTTGSWHMLLTEVQERHDRLKEDENKFYFIYKHKDKDKDKDSKNSKDIKSEFHFNDLVKDIQLDSKGKIILDLVVKIKGKKPYAEWTTKDMLKEILHGEYESIDGIPVLDIDKTFGTERVLNDEEFRNFTTNLAEITSAFHEKVDTNEATARNFINPFMVKAVTKVISKYPSTRLAVEEEFDGSRGYGRLDYVVYCHKLAILITEAKMTEMQKGITQNIVQLHTAAEKKRKREAPARTVPSVFYGIVSTGKQWQFIRWSEPPNAPSTPIVEVSKSYSVVFGEGMAGMHGVTDVVSIIIRILQSCAEAEAENNRVDNKKVENQEDTELAGPMAQRVRRE